MMLDVIARRRSVRSYAAGTLAGDVLDEVRELLAAERTGHFGHAPRFWLVEKAMAQQDKKVKLGTYGFIKGPQYFVAGAVQRGKLAEVDYGRALEEIILELTRLGLGTCWLGGTFSRKEWGQVLGLKKGEFIPAITPVGQTADRRGLMERMVRWGAGSDNRLPFESLFFDQGPQTPLTEAAAGHSARVLEAVRMGPSASNKQPWRILRRDGAWHLYLVRTPGYAKTVKAADLQLIDMGIAMAHFELAAQEVGLDGHWRTADPGISSPVLGHYIVSWA